jgi:hypothetical protein
MDEGYMMDDWEGKTGNGSNVPALAVNQRGVQIINPFCTSSSRGTETSLDAIRTCETV